MTVHNHSENTVVRVRFAPSPTGYPHLGNIRTALFTWLFARHHGGQFILRIEDTDVNRKVEGSLEAIMDSLRWLGLDWDEGPYFQSQRLALYNEAVGKLLSNGHAYKCYCSPERLAIMRQEQITNRKPPKYDGRCRSLSEEERNILEASGTTPVVRLKVPIDGETSFYDMLRGKISFKNENLDDLVLLKSDGYPTYHLANVVDDHLMNISHVLRADEWVSSTPKHMLLYQAFNWEPPQFAHLPMLLGSDKAKLSKRHGATTIIDYKDNGFLPQAMVNFLALLGWSLDDKTEILSIQELITHFTLKRVSKTPAIFNNNKLEWMNGLYIRKLSTEEFRALAVPILERDLPPVINRPLNIEYINQILPLIQERSKTLVEVVQLSDFFFLKELQYDINLLLADGLDSKSAIDAITTTLEEFKKDATSWDATALEDTIRPLTVKLDLSTRKFFGLLRTATTGKIAAPPLFQTMAILGKEKCFQRLNDAIDKLSRLDK